MSIPTDLSALKEAVNKPEEVNEEGPTPIEDLRSTAYTPDQLKTAWSSFVKNRSFQNLDLELLNNPYELEGDKITVSIPNEALVASFEKFRSDLLLHLRDSLKNDHIKLESKIVELEKEKMLYTDREKFNYLKEKYPALKDLQDKLGLDPEF